METILYMIRDKDRCVNVYSDADAGYLFDYFFTDSSMNPLFPETKPGKLTKVRITIEEVKE